MWAGTKRQKLYYSKSRQIKKIYKMFKGSRTGPVGLGNRPKVTTGLEAGKR